MNVITPTITTADPHDFRAQLLLIEGYADGVHLDFADGDFAPTTLLPIERAWRSGSLITHAHIMYKRPLKVLNKILALEADLVILHAESEDVLKCLKKLHAMGIRTGVALLPETTVAVLDNFKGYFDHVLVFGGHLGYQGGEADLDQLVKVKLIKKEYPDVEISWDGGINDKNVNQIAEAGVSVLNVGGFIKNAKHPKKAYDLLTSLVS